LSEKKNFYLSNVLKEKCTVQCTYDEIEKYSIQNAPAVKKYNAKYTGIIRVLKQECL